MPYISLSLNADLNDRRIFRVSILWKSLRCYLWNLLNSFLPQRLVNTIQQSTFRSYSSTTANCSTNCILNLLVCLIDIWSISFNLLILSSNLILLAVELRLLLLLLLWLALLSLVFWYFSKPIEILIIATLILWDVCVVLWISSITHI